MSTKKTTTHQSITKSNELERLETILLKARRRMSDEAEDPDEQEASLEDQGYREFDPDADEDDADKWLQENDPEKQDEENEDESDDESDDEPDEYDEYGPDEDEESHQQDTEPEEPGDEPIAEDETPGTEGGASSEEQGGPDQGSDEEEVPEEAPVTKIPEGVRGSKAPPYKATQMFGFDDLGQIKSAKSLDEAKQYARFLIDRQKAAFGSNKQKAHDMVDNAKSIDNLMTGMYNTSEKYAHAANKEGSAKSRNQAGYGPTDDLSATTGAGAGESRFPQPSREEIAEMRQHTRPWEQNAREQSRLKAEAHKNPVLHHQGKMIEARNAAHKSHQDAYAEFQNSPDYQNADPITQMEMDNKFESDFHKQNPDYLANAAKLHGQAHIEGLQGQSEGYGNKKDSIQHIRQGGASPETPMSVEEGMQHAGGAKGEEGTTGSMAQDPATAFATHHKKFLDEMGAKHEDTAGGKQKKYAEMAQQYASKLGSDGDLKSMIGKHSPEIQDRLKRIDSFKNAAGKTQKQSQAKSKSDQFFEKYHPLISMHAHKVLNKLGLDKKNVDLGILHEAGMHGLMQAINDYDHENPGKASFATHAGNKISGLMQTAMRDQIQTPQQLTSEAKKFSQKQQASVPKVTTPKPEGGTNE